MKTELKLNQDNTWSVVQGATIVSTHATIKLATDARFELTSRKPRQVIAFRQDGTEITKRIRRAS